MKTGDLVSILDENFKGKITSLQGRFAVVEDEHGFEHRVELQKLVPQNPTIYEGTHIIKKQESTIKNSKKNVKSERVLDLHFEQLVPNPQDYDSWERLFLQKEKLMEQLDYCRKNFIRKLTIIHGIGDGVLQDMVYETLRGFAGIDYEENDFFYHSSGNVVVTFR